MSSLHAALLLSAVTGVCCVVFHGESSLSLLHLKGDIESVKATSSRSHPWPTKNGNLNHTGYSAIIAPSELGAPSWEYKVPVPLHTSPVIDDEGNVYLAHGKGVISLDKHGHERWVNKPESPGIPALLGDELFTCSSSGRVRAVDLKTGVTRWEKKVAMNCPGDSWVAAATGNTVLVPCNVDKGSDGNCDVVALDTVNGSVLWRYSLCDNGFTRGYNMMMSIVDGAVIMQDSSGGVHRLDLATGKPMWATAGHPHTMTTGGMLVGPNGVVYGASNREGSCDSGKGVLRALDLRTGVQRWWRDFATGVNAGPAIGHLQPGGPLAVVICEGDNFLPGGIQTAVGLMTLGIPAPLHKGKVYAINAETAETIWSYEVAPYKSWIYPQMMQGCLPDAFGNPAIGGDGTVYVSWSGGYGYAIKDANGDGNITENEVSKLRTDSGMNAETAISPSLMILPSCDGVRGYTF